MYRVCLFPPLLKSSLCTIRGSVSLLLQIQSQISNDLPKPRVIADFRRSINDITSLLECRLIVTYRRFGTTYVSFLRIILGPLDS
jgi:hypothetical protein